MKIGLIGDGKTGGKVKDLHPNVVVFNTSNRPEQSALQECDVLVVFAPGEALLRFTILLWTPGVPAVMAATGFTYPEDTDEN